MSGSSLSISSSSEDGGGRVLTGLDLGRKYAVMSLAGVGLWSLCLPDVPLVGGENLM